MKKLLLLWMLIISSIINSQTNKTIYSLDSLSGFDEKYHTSFAFSSQYSGNEFTQYLNRAKRNFIINKYNLPQPSSSYKPGNPTPNAAPCVNEDFEATPNVPFTTVPQGGAVSNPAGWTITSGQNGTFFNNIYYTTCSVSAMPAGIFVQPVTECWVRSTPIADPNFPGGVPNSPLGGTKVLQLNDNLAVSGQITRASQTFPVTSSNALFQFAYAACFNGTGHLCCDQPFLNIKVKDCLGNTLSCPQVTVIASGPSCTTGTSGFLTNALGYLYKNWTIQSIDLTPYIGSCVTIEVSVGDCTGWAHFGYCYFDAVCKPITLQVNNNFFPAGTNAILAAGCNTTTAVMVAPAGLGPYNWTGPTGSSNSQTLTTNVTGNYTLTMTPPGACAPIVKTVSLSFGSNPTSGFTSSNTCNNYTFTNTGSTLPSFQTYSFVGTGAPASYTTTSPSSSITFTSSGTYTIQQIVTNTIGCTSTTTLAVNVPAGPLLTVSNVSICPGANANLSVNGATSYTWTGPNLSNPNISNPIATPTITTIYSISGSNAIGCVGTKTLQVTVLPTPTLTINSPTICSGNIANLISTGATSYTWTPNIGLNNPNISNPTSTTTTTTIYTVTGTGTNGCTSSKTTTLTVNPLPILSITSATTCANITTTISASGATTYSWSTGALTSSITASPSVNTTYTVTGTSSTGCKSVGVATITIKPNLIVNLTNNGPLCTGSNLNLTSNVGSIWNWTGPSSFTSTTQNPTINNTSINNSGTYSVNVIDAFGCTGSASINVIVNPLPTPNIVSNSPVCTNQPLNFTGSGGVTYSWSGPSFNSNLQNPSINNTSINNSGTYTLTVTDINGCINSTTINTLVNPLPIVSVSGSTVCSGATAFLNSNGGVSYSWSGPGGFTSNLQNPTFIGASTQLNGNYVVTVTDANGCINANMANLLISPPFTVNVTNNSPICENEDLNLVCTQSFSTYTWNGPNGFVANNPFPTIQFVNSLANGTYTLIVSDALGCLGSTTTNVLINPKPKINIINSTDKLCAPACISFTASTDIPTNQINWNFVGGVSTNSTIATQCYNKGGIYASTLTATSINGCTSIQTNSIEIYDTPIADYTYSPLYPIENEEVYLTNASFGYSGINTLSSVWYYNNIAQSLANSPTVTFSNPGTYVITLVVITNKGCADTISKIINVKEDYFIYVPNTFTPNGDGLNDVFQPKGQGIAKYELMIFDRWGEMIYETKEFNQGWDGKYHRGIDYGTYCKDDIYTWLIKVVDTFGKSHELKGHVTLIK